jgi:hypothetical protein
VNWYHACLRVAMIVVALGVMWMHSSAHDGHACHELTATHAVEAVMPMESDADAHEDGAHRHAGALCAAMLTAMCLAVLTILASLLGVPPLIALRALQARDSIRLRANAFLAGVRWSFMELSVFRI